jgi:L-ascorbate metabolism protein UlaG (beta-lactamase superfamily)
MDGVVVHGYASKSTYGGTPRINTVYVVTLEEMKLCFLGALSDEQLSPELFEALDDIDILFIPIGGNGVLDAKVAHKLSVSLEPNIVIPMHYTKEALTTFLKEEGETSVRPLDKVTLKKKDILEKEGEIIVLSPQA